MQPHKSQYTKVIYYTLFFISLPEWSVAKNSTAEVFENTIVYGGRPFVLVLLLMMAIAAAMAIIGTLRAKHANRRANQIENKLLQHLNDTAEQSDKEKELSALMLNASIGIYRSSLDGSHFLEANKQLANAYGMDDLDEFIRTVSPLDLYKDPEGRNALVRNLQQSGFVSKLELPLRTKSGHPWHAVTSAVLSTRTKTIVGIVYDSSAEYAAREELRRNSIHLQRLIDAMPIPLFFKDEQGRYKTINQAYTRLMNQPADNIIGQTVEAIASPKYAQLYNEAEEVFLRAAGPAVQQYETGIETEEGIVDVLVCSESVFNENNMLAGIVGVTFDITSRKETEAALRRAEERYRAIFMHALNGIFTCSSDGKLQDVNPAFARMFGYTTREELLGRQKPLKAFWARDADYKKMLSNLHVYRQVTAQRVEVKRINGSHFWAEITCQAFYDYRGTATHIEGVISDVTQHMMQEQELRAQASTDKLTGLSNRYGLDEAFERLLAQAKRSRCKIGVAFIDLDGFKEINDRFGHDIGDRVLNQVGQRLYKRIRDSDVIARLGGDEFAVLLWNVKGEDDLIRFGESILEALEEPYQCGTERCSLSASMGMSIYPSHGDSPGTLLRQADHAMYAVKRSGKNAVKLASDIHAA